MSSFEDILSVAMKPDTTGPTGDWERVERAVERRADRRAMVLRGVMAAFAVALAAALLSRTGSPPIETALDLATPVDEVAEGASTGPWPSRADRAGEAGSSVPWMFRIAWLVGLGLPTLAGMVAWLCAPEHLRVPIASQRWARTVLAAAAGLAAAVGVGTLVGLLLLGWYDPLGAQSGTSALYALLRPTRFALLATTVALAIAQQAARLQLGSGFWRAGSFLVGAAGSAALATIPWTLAFAIGGPGLGWHQALDADGPLRGVWRVLVPGGHVLVDRFGSEISVGWAWSGLAMLSVVGAGCLWWARYSVGAVIAGSALVTWSDRERGSRRGRLGFWLGVIAVALPVWTSIAHDARAQSVAPLITVPASVPADADVAVRRTLTVSPFDDWSLVEVEMRNRSGRGDDAFADVSDTEIFPARLGFERRSEGYWRDHGRPGFPSEREWWTVERSDDGLVVRGEVDPVSGQSSLVNLTLWVGAWFGLAATSRHLHARASEEITARVMAGWVSVGVGVWLVFGIIRSYVRVEALLEPFGGTPSYEQLGTPGAFEVHRQWSEATYFLRSMALLPAAVLVVAGAHRLSGRRWVAAVVAALAGILVIFVESRWSGLITVGNDIVE